MPVDKPEPPSRSRPPSKPGIPTRQHTPVPEKKTGTMTLEEFVNENPNLRDLQKLDIALQIAEITRKTHESKNCNLDFSLQNFQVNKIGTKIDISVHPDFRKEMGKIDPDLGGARRTFRNTDPNPNTTPPELRNPTDTQLEGVATPRSDVWKMGQAFKAIGLPDELRSWISTDKPEKRPDLNERIIPALKNAIEHIQIAEATPITDEIVATPPPSQSLDLTGYTIKMMSEYDPHNIPDKNTIYFSTNGDFKIYEKDMPNATYEGNIDLRSPNQSFLKNQLDEPNETSFKKSLKSMISEEITPTKSVSEQKPTTESIVDTSDEEGIEIPFSPHDEPDTLYHEEFIEHNISEPMIEMKVDIEEENRADVRQQPVVYKEKSHFSPYPPIESPLMSREMQTFRDAIFEAMLDPSLVGHSDELRYTLKGCKELRDIINDEANKEMDIISDYNKLSAIRNKVESSREYWTRALETASGNPEDIKKLKSLIILDLVIMDYNALILDSPNTLSDKKLSKIQELLGTIENSLESNDIVGDDRLRKELNSKLSDAKSKSSHISNSRTNNRPEPLGLGHQLLHSFRNAIVSFKNFVSSGIRNLANSITGESKRNQSPKV
jgi:hypothetical protein